ncbi:MAG: DUF58 domain-containing protein [Anaerolineales bacterium]|jgi:uncharacterized protein (DUF58 family)
MSDYWVPFLLALAVIAAFLRADFVLTLIYLLLGVWIIGRVWSRRALEAVKVRREFVRRAFLGERISISLELHNQGLLPVVWLQLNESLPVELRYGDPAFSRVVSMGPQNRLALEYTLEGHKRGYYPIGPLMLYSGDVFGLAGRETRRLASDYLTVYPKIVPLTSVSLPTQSPMGTLRHHQPIFADPSRVFGKREYVSGDSLRSVDWKATASSGQLQVKLFEPSIALEAEIFLDLNTEGYEHHSRASATELAIVVAASLANWIVLARQSVGLLTNGTDPLSKEGTPPRLLPRNGRAHLMRILDVLARVQAGQTQSLDELIQRESVHLSWGTTLIVITPHLDEAFFDVLFQARRSGFDIILIPCGPVPGLQQVRQIASTFGFPLVHILSEQDLDIWRR